MHISRCVCVLFCVSLVCVCDAFFVYVVCVGASVFVWFGVPWRLVCVCVLGCSCFLEFSVSWYVCSLVFLLLGVCVCLCFPDSRCVCVVRGVLFLGVRDSMVCACRCVFLEFTCPLVCVCSWVSCVLESVCVTIAVCFLVVRVSWCVCVLLGFRVP